MAVPLIIGAAAAAAGLYGASKGVRGARDHSEAKSLNNDAHTMVDKANSNLEEARKQTNTCLEDYGRRKLRAFDGVIPLFIKTFERVKNVELEGSVELDKLNVDGFSSTSLADLRQDYQALKDSGLGVGAGLTSGAALAFGAYNGTMLLASASTGAAISSLSGAAATNATLAWLGGGSLAAGGYGMAGGMMVLGGLVAGPALAVFGHILGNKGEEALNNARSNMEEALTIKEEIELAVEKLRAVEEVVSLANQIFSQTSLQLRKSLRMLKIVLVNKGEDFSVYSKEEKEIVFLSVKFMQLLKAMIDTPILDQDGNLVLSTKKRVEEIAEVVDSKAAEMPPL